MSLPDYPFRGEYFVTPGDARMHYLDEGPCDAPPVLMVHGNPTWSYSYRHVIAALSDRYRCIVPDHIGMGQSEVASEPGYRYVLEQRVADLDALIEHLNPPGPIDLIVHDWGGMIGFAWARQHLHRIRRMVVLNTAAFPLPYGKTFPWQLRWSRGALGAFLVRGLNGFCRYAVKHGSSTGLDPDVAKAYLAPYNNWNNRLAVHRFVQDIPLAPSDPGWELINKVAGDLQRFQDKPMLIAWGLKDFVFDAHFLQEWEQRFPNATVHRYDNAGHYILEDAGTDLIPRISAFLDNATS